MEQDCTFSVIFANHPYPVTTSVNSQVTCHTQSLQQCDTVAGDSKATRTSDFAHHGNLEVQELYRHNRILNQIAFDQLVFDQFGQLHTGQAFHMDFSQDGKVDVSVRIHQIP